MKKLKLSTQKLIEEIKSICSSNVGKLQSADCFSKEFAKIIDLIDENTHQS